MNFPLPLRKPLNDGTDWDEPDKPDTATQKEVAAPQRILQTVVAALNQGKVSEALDRFAPQFKFTDHALELEFGEKERLGAFFQKTRDLFPDAMIVESAVFEYGNSVVLEWLFTATKDEPFLGGLVRRVPIALRGISVVRIANEKIIRWSDYYDNLTSRRTGLVSFFKEWSEY